MRKTIGILALLLCMSGAKAQVAEPSSSLTEVDRSGSTRYYTFNYPSKGIGGEDVILSSLLVAWMPTSPSSSDSIESLHIYNHFTILSDKECPSSDENSKEHTIFNLLVGSRHGLSLNSAYNFISRCIVIAPDYEGYGVSKHRSHPYLSQGLTAKQVVDGVTYGLMLYQKLAEEKRALALKSNWRSFNYGFSQGGAVALAVHRYIEESGQSEQLRFRGSICGDGPYDIITTLSYYVNDNGSNYGTTTDHQRGMTTMPMVIPLIIKGLLDTHPLMKGHCLEDYLSQQFLDTGIMDWIASKEYTVNDIHKLWYQQLKNGLRTSERYYNTGKMSELFYSPKTNRVWARLDKLFTPAFFEYISDPVKFGTVPQEKGDPFQDIHRAMDANNVCRGWQPMHRIQFVHSKNDMVVPYGNYLSFLSAHQEDEGVLFRIDDGLSPADHIDAGTNFYLKFVSGSYGEFFTWLDATPEPTSITPAYGEWQMANDGWFTLDGRRLNTRPTRKGIYIHRNQKITIN